VLCSIVVGIFDVDSAVCPISNDEILVGRVKIVSSIQGWYIKADVLKFCLDALDSLLKVPKSNKAVKPCDQTRNLICVDGKRQLSLRVIYRFFHPPLCPGAPPVERGVGPNSGPDWRESVGWKILLPLPGSMSSGEGLRGVARPGR
jgi:hypothetical protein